MKTNSIPLAVHLLSVCIFTLNGDLCPSLMHYSRNMNCMFTITEVRQLQVIRMHKLLHKFCNSCTLHCNIGDMMVK